MKFASRLGIIKDSIFLVLKRPFYVLITFIVAFLMLSFSVLILNISLIFDPITPAYSIFDKALLLFKLLGGLITNNTPIAIALLIITSLLAGINVALLVFKIKSLKSATYKESGLGTSGAVAGMLASGCSSCGISILSLIGIAGVLTFLPFKGLELSFAGIILLLFSIYSTSKGIVSCESCKVQFKSTG